MKTQSVKDLMIPLSEYATVSIGDTLFDVVMALKKAQEEFDPAKHKHRAVLVFDKNNKIVGKVSQFDILRALEPKYDEMLTPKKSFHLGFTRRFQQTMLEQLRLLDGAMEHICQKAIEKKVETFMYTPEEGEYIEINATMNAAIHQFVIGQQQSLLVTENKDIVGILRLTDVFEFVADSVIACKIK